MVSQDEVNKIDPSVKNDADTKARCYLRKEITRLRDELEDGNRAMLDVRRNRLKRLYALESIHNENTLRHLGYAFVPPQP